VSSARTLAVDGLHHECGSLRNGHRPAYVVIGERLQRVRKHIPPAAPTVPPSSSARVLVVPRTRCRDCGPVSLRRWLEIAPARTHVSRHVLHDDGDGIGLGAENREERRVGTLRHGSLGEIFVVAKKIDGVFYVRGGELVWHVVIFFRFRELSSHAATASLMPSHQF